MTVIDQPSFDLSCFAVDYSDARSKFIDAAELAGAGLASYENPNKGPHGEDLSVDTAWLGTNEARKVLVTVSGTHGPEGFCGSGCQVDWFSKFGPPPTRIALLFIHALISIRLCVVAAANRGECRSQSQPHRLFEIITDKCWLSGACRCLRSTRAVRSLVRGCGSKDRRLCGKARNEGNANRPFGRPIHHPVEFSSVERARLGRGEPWR